MSSSTSDEHSRPARAPGKNSVEDRLNSEIIRMLEVDGRMAFSEIAQRLEVSEGTIRNRVNAMKATGMLRIVAIADPRTSEYKADAMVCLSVAPGVTPQAVANRLTAITSVVYVLWLTGRFDLLIEIVCEDSAELSDFLDEHIYSHHDITNAEVMLGLKNFKNQFLLKRDWLSERSGPV